MIALSCGSMHTLHVNLHVLSQYLLHNLGGAEVAPQAHAPGEAELAVLRAADLRGYAQRRPLRPAGVGPLHWNNHRLYRARCTLPLHRTAFSSRRISIAAWSAPM